MTSQTLTTQSVTVTAKHSHKPRVNRVPIEAPWVWLASGWRDLWVSPMVSLLYGAAFAFVAVALLPAMLEIGWQSVVPALAGGFLLVGPILAVGLYEKSRRLEMREPISVFDVVMVGVRSPGQLALIGVGMLMVYFVWIIVAFLLLAIFLGAQPLPPYEEFLPTLLFTPQGIGLLVTGTIAGGLLAALVFSISAVSVPLLMVHDLDVVTAVATSLAAVWANLRPMALWATLIAGLMVLGFATLFVGLIVAFPLIGHATWHAYRDLVAFEVEPEIVASAI